MSEKDRERKEKLKLLKHFGSQLVKIRKSKGLTPAELARRCYMERSSIARLETGRTNPSLFVLKKLTDGLEIKLDEFFKEFQ